MTYKYNPFTGKLDDVGDLTATTAAATYVAKAGDTMTGDLRFSTSLIGIILNDGSASWRVTVNSSGALVTTQVANSPLGPSLGLANL